MCQSRFLTLGVLAATLLAGCNFGGSETPHPRPKPPPEMPPEMPPPPPVLDHGSRGYDARSYGLRGHFDWGTQELIASEDISLVTASLAPGDAVVELDAAVAVTGVHAGTQELRFAAVAATSKLYIDLTPLGPGAQPVSFTIDFRAPTAYSLVAWTSADDDPASGHVVLTDSEPAGGELWMVAKQDPSDRALFSLELTVGADEDVVSNGHRTSDQTSAGERVVRYQIDEPLPTYAMAFAAGTLEHTAGTAGGVPISLWHRRGLAVDAESYLADIADAMASFEKLIGPYPWESYAVVLVPIYMGGMENVTISFIGEAYGHGKYAFGFNAHELAHQWFGDWVTVRSFDDLWIKEGMATLLEAEAQRARRDGESKGRGFATDFHFAADAAIVDKTLLGEDKYNSGPYERAAWLLGLIRARIGEPAFWAALRGVLDAHALDSIDSETFVRSFAPALDAATIEQIIASLPEHESAVPVVEVMTADGMPDSAELTLTLTQAGQQLLVPIAITVVDADGQATTSALVPGVPLTLTLPAGGYLAPDEGDLHPLDVVFSHAGYELLRSHFAPSSPAAIAAFASRSAAQQERAFAPRPAPAPALPFGAAQLGGFYAQLDSEIAREGTALAACRALAPLVQDDPAATEWIAALVPIVRNPGRLVYDTSYARCGVALATQALAPELVQLAAMPTARTLARLEYLMSFDYGEVDSLTLIGQLATQALSRRLQDLAIDRLTDQALGLTFPRVRGHVDAWLAFFRARLAEAHTRSRVDAAWWPLRSLRDLAALPILADLLRRGAIGPSSQRYYICSAYGIAGSPTASAWTDFLAAVQPWTTLAAEAQAVLADPATCNP